MLKAKLNMIGIGIVLLAAPLSSIAEDGFASLTNIVGKVLIEKDSGVVAGQSGMALFLDENIIALRGASAQLKFVNGCSVSLAANKRLSVVDAASCCGIVPGDKGVRNAALCQSPQQPQPYSGGGAGDVMATVNPTTYQTLTALTGGVFVSKSGANTYNNSTLPASAAINSAVVTDTLPGSSNNNGSAAAQRPLADASASGSTGSTEVAAVKVPVLPTAPPRPQVYRPMLPATKNSGDEQETFIPPSFFPGPAWSLSDC